MQILPEETGNRPVGNVVYYVGVPGDGYVKIGTTKNLKSRLSSLAGSRHDGDKLTVFATEAGGYDVEQERHEQFSATRGHGEWFKITPELQAHIDRLSAMSHPSYALGYDAGYMAAISDKEAANLIKCSRCGEMEPPAYQSMDDDICDICMCCYSDEADSITTVEIVDFFVQHMGLGWTPEGFRRLPPPVQRRLVLICNNGGYPSQSFKDMMREVTQ